MSGLRRGNAGDLWLHDRPGLFLSTLQAACKIILARCCFTRNRHPNGVQEYHDVCFIHDPFVTQIFT